MSRLHRLSLLGTILNFGQGFNKLSLDSIEEGTTKIIDSIKLDPERGAMLTKLDDAIRLGSRQQLVKDGTLQFDSAGEKAYDNGKGLAHLLAGSLETVSKQNQLTLDSIDTAINALGSMVERPQVKLWLDQANALQGAEILATAVTVQTQMILHSALPFVGHIGDMKKITSGNGKSKLAVYTLTPTVKKGMGNLEDDTLLNPLNSLEVFGDSTRSKDFVIDATLVYELDMKAKASDTTNYKLEKGVNEVTIQGLDYQFSDFNVSPKANNPTDSYKDKNGVDIKAEWLYDDGKIKVTFSDATDYKDRILSIVGGLNTDKTEEIRGSVENTHDIFEYVSRYISLSTSWNLESARQMLIAPRIDIMGENLSLLVQTLANGQKGKYLKNALRFSAKTKRVGDLNIAAVSGTAGQFSEQAKSFLVAVRVIGSEILTDSTLTKKICLVGGTALEALFLKLDTNTHNIVRTNISNDNGIFVIGTIGKDIICIIDPNYDIKYPKTATGYWRVDVVGNPDDVGFKVVQAGVDLPLIPREVSLDKNSNQYIYYEGKLINDSNKNPLSQKLVKHMLFKD